jgi:hypothetical protein
MELGWSIGAIAEVACLAALELEASAERPTSGVACTICQAPLRGGISCRKKQIFVAWN